MSCEGVRRPCVDLRSRPGSVIPLVGRLLVEEISDRVTERRERRLGALG